MRVQGWSRCWSGARRLGMRLTLILALTGLITGGCGTGGGWSPPDAVLAPELVHYGGSYADWSVLWWQWALEHARPNHPLFDQTGADADEDQVDPVWFLGGLLGVLFQPGTFTATRDVTIPPNTALFFPIINAEWDNAFCLPPGWVDLTAGELAGIAYDQVNQVSDVTCHLNGFPLIDSPDLAGAERFRAVAGNFLAAAPFDHVGVELCGMDPDPILVEPIASDGIWMFLAPLPPGRHVLSFAGSLPVIGGGFFRVEMTYNLTVLGPP